MSSEDRSERTRRSDNQPWYIKHGGITLAFVAQFIGAIAWATNLHGDVQRAQTDINNISEKIERGQQIISEMPYLKNRIDTIEKKLDQSIMEQQSIRNTLARIEAKVS